ncbi:hypothetical protein DPMN_045351 [Dreissena polymorpha]|uniref:Uncharacterized protein n=1 Tax=Dreissena polymorpha TaxID=45954 RepID=A0A9D4D628_DREPO|nr:hypothetical protein DPMN_045351 [Dreissena polymorpha]
MQYTDLRHNKFLHLQINRVAIKEKWDTAAIASLQCQMREMGHICHSEPAMSDERNGTQLP